jgi:hypothetical protein
VRFFDLLGRVTGRHGSCSSVLPRRNALYDAPRVIFQARLKGSKAMCYLAELRRAT